MDNQEATLELDDTLKVGDRVRLLIHISENARHGDTGVIIKIDTPQSTTLKDGLSTAVQLNRNGYILYFRQSELEKIDKKVEEKKEVDPRSYLLEGVKKYLKATNSNISMHSEIGISEVTTAVTRFTGTITIELAIREVDTHEHIREANDRY